jgi:hypothetical protein
MDGYRDCADPVKHPTQDGGPPNDALTDDADMSPTTRAMVYLAVGLILLMAFVAVAGAITGTLDPTAVILACVTPLTGLVGGLVWKVKSENGSKEE